MYNKNSYIAILPMSLQDDIRNLIINEVGSDDENIENCMCSRIGDLEDLNCFTDILMLLDLKITIERAIKKLMNNDKNTTWDECRNTEELKEGLTEALKGYDETEETYQFYNGILKNLK